MDKEKVKKLYLLGYTIKEISKIVAAKETTVKVCINRNFKAFRKEHFYANKARKEALKAINYEAKKDMGDKAFVESNMSIYKMKESGDIIINKKVAPIVTYDTPKRLGGEEDLTRKKIKS